MKATKLKSVCDNAKKSLKLKMADAIYSSDKVIATQGTMP